MTERGDADTRDLNKDNAMQIIETTATPPEKKSVLDFLIGRPLCSDEDVKEQIRSSAGVPVFGWTRSVPLGTALKPR